MGVGGHELVRILLALNTTVEFDSNTTAVQMTLAGV
jgi:hypothetical protein